MRRVSRFVQALCEVVEVSVEHVAVDAERETGIGCTG
jgi:hypothetical protein